MRVLLSTHGLRGHLEPTVGFAGRSRGLGAEMPVCPPPDLVELRPAVGAAVMPNGRPARRRDQGDAVAAGRAAPARRPVGPLGPRR